MKNLIQQINQIVPLDDIALAKFISVVNATKISKGSILLKQKAIENHIYFIEKGLLCGIIYNHDKDIINWFATENQFVTSLSSFITQKPSFENIVALEETELYKINYNDLQKLFSEFTAFERLGRILTEQYYVQLEERSLSLQYESAKQRYHTFVQSNSSLLHRISLGQLASYLGISQETLSRIRAKK